MATDTSGVGKVPAGRVKTRPFFSLRRLWQPCWRCPYQHPRFTGEAAMFAESLLEPSWAQRSRHGWTTATSFGLQVLAIGVLLLVPLLRTARLPPGRVLPTPISWGAPPPAPPIHRAHVTTLNQSNMWEHRLIAPPSIPP